ncbi:MAG: lasso peptide biosynthesis B2 protein [Actinomycetota bacterium]|nr:lasso peptide biosynthesis B2 protein [Actinomycetota bacterium]
MASTSEALVLEYQLDRDVLWVQCDDGSSRLFHMDANASVLDRPSTELLASVLESGRAGAVRGLVERYDADPTDVERDVSRFVAELRAQGLIRRMGEQRPQSAALRAHMARLALPPALDAARLRRPDIDGLARRHLVVARLAVAAFGWARTLEEWERRFPQPPDPGPGADSYRQVERIDRAVWESAERSLLWPDCKERSLASVALARGAGIPADLVVGASFIPLRAHVWVECGDRVVGDDPDRPAVFEPLGRYTGSGAPRRVSSPAGGPAVEPAVVRR